MTRAIDASAAPISAPPPAVAAGRDLVRLLEARDGPALATVMRQNNRRLFRLARSIVVDETEAEDVLQESYVRAFTHLDGFRGQASLATWLARIVANEALQRVRRRRPTVPVETIAETLAATSGLAPAAAPAPSPEDEVARRELGRLLERAVDRLPADFRAVFVLRALEQMSVEDTAAALGVRPETVKTRFHRANRLLRRALAADLDRVFDDAFPFAGARCERIVSAVLARLGVAERAAAPRGMAADSRRA